MIVKQSTTLQGRITNYRLSTAALEEYPGLTIQLLSASACEVSIVNAFVRYYGVGDFEQQEDMIWRPISFRAYEAEILHDGNVDELISDLKKIGGFK